MENGMPIGRDVVKNSRDMLLNLITEKKMLTL